MRKWNWAQKQKHIPFDEIDSQLRLIRKKCEPIQSYCRSEKTALIMKHMMFRDSISMLRMLRLHHPILCLSKPDLFKVPNSLTSLFFVKLSWVLHNTLLANHKSLLMILLCFQPPSVSLFGTHGRYLLFLSHV